MAGRALEYQIEPGRRPGTYDALRLGVPAPLRARALFRREHGGDRFARALRLIDEIQTGDARFDPHVFVLSDDPAMQALLADDAVARRAILDLFSDGRVTHVRCNRGRLWLELDATGIVAGGAPSDWLDAVAARHAPALATLQTCLHELPTGEALRAREPFARRETACYAACALVALAGIIAFVFSLGLGLPRPLALDAAERLAGSMTVVAALGLLGTAYALLAGSARTHLVLIEIVLTALPGVWLLARTAAIEFNQAADRSAPIAYEAHVEPRQVTRVSRRLAQLTVERHLLVVSRWPDRRVPRAVAVSARPRPLHRRRVRNDRLSPRPARRSVAAVGRPGPLYPTALGAGRLALAPVNALPRRPRAPRQAGCYPRDTRSRPTMSTTSIKLPPALKARVARLAKSTGRSPHSLIVEAVERHTAAEERMQQFVADALAADADIERTGEAFRAEDVHAWLDRLAKGRKSARPKPWRR
ncbi:MAG: hypothetical protein ACK52I_03480 [Pseudomonadota bacterium]